MYRLQTFGEISDFLSPKSSGGTVWANRLLFLHLNEKKWQ
jgi:hypothetical protein